MTSRRLFLGLVAAGTATLRAAAKKLIIERPALAQSEDGTPEPSDFEWAPGEVVFFSCQVAGYTKLPKEDDFIVDLAYEIAASDAQGVLIIPVETGKVASSIGAEDKEWLPKIRHSIALPPLAETGRYKVNVKVLDNLTKSEAQASIPLVVRGRNISPSDTLVVRNFRFLRSEEDKNPLQPAAYRPGDTVWARFDMTGYKLGEGNGFDVEYGLRVLRSNGEVTYEQARAAQEKNQSFYPQRHTPGILSLSLPADLKRGQFTIVLTVRDNLGSQLHETRQKFEVE